MSKLERIQQMALRLVSEIARMQNEFSLELCFDEELQMELSAKRKELAALARQASQIRRNEAA